VKNDDVDDFIEPGIIFVYYYYYYYCGDLLNYLVNIKLNSRNNKIVGEVFPHSSLIRINISFYGEEIVFDL